MVAKLFLAPGLLVVAVCAYFVRPRHVADRIASLQAFDLFTFIKGYSRTVA
jgi:hypothetical protein